MQFNIASLLLLGYETAGRQVSVLLSGRPPVDMAPVVWFLFVLVSILLGTYLLAGEILRAYRQEVRRMSRRLLWAIVISLLSGVLGFLFITPPIF